jgi:dTDP-4-dehydrorhamnose reductase
MKILVLGASGQVGHLLMRVARGRGHEPIGTYCHHEVAGLERLDLNDIGATRRLTDRVRPDWVVNCASWTWVDGNELDPSRAERENVDTVACAADAANTVGARWCYLSSSYVFDGSQTTPYSENDPVSPVSVYGRAKLRGEEITRRIFGEAGLIVRTIVVWGPDLRQKNFASQVIRHALGGKEMSVPVDQIGNPTYGPDLASAVLQLMERPAGGVWNVAGPEAHLDRVAFAKLICQTLGLDGGFIKSVTTAQLGQPARRPLNGSLATAKLEAAGLSLRATAEALQAWRRGEWEWPWNGP